MEARWQIEAHVETRARHGGRAEKNSHEVDTTGLLSIYEQDFLDCSYGRPKRSAHDAIRTLDRIVHRGEVIWILGRLD